MRRLEEPKPTPEEMRKKSRLRRYFYIAVNRGEIKRRPCEVCGNVSVEAHHPDLISKPFEVVWLCKKHHWEEEAKSKGEYSSAHLRVRVPKYWIKLLQTMTNQNTTMSQLIRLALQRFLVSRRKLAKETIKKLEV